MINRINQNLAVLEHIGTETYMLYFFARIDLFWKKDSRKFQIFICQIVI